MMKVLLAVLFFCLFAMGYFALAGTFGNNQEFDRSAWLDASNTERLGEARSSMIRDLLRNHLVLGRERSEVIALLGSPTETPYFSDHDLVYWVGHEQSFFSIDSSWLVIDFNEYDKLVLVQILTD